jgi:hypothetical protein
MDPSAPFLVRRVVVGVFVGVVLLLLAFYGWVRYRTSQYEHSRSEMLVRYQNAYTLCVDAGTPELVCSRRIYSACTHDAFWATEKPFSFDLQSGSDEASTHCRGAG